MPDAIKRIRRCVRCSACHGRFDRLNLVQLDRLATWKYPTAGNFMTGEQGFAVAIVCDRCIEIKARIVEAVEMNGDVVHYHPLDSLAKQRMKDVPNA